MYEGMVPLNWYLLGRLKRKVDHKIQFEIEVPGKAFEFPKEVRQMLTCTCTNSGEP